MMVVGRGPVGVRVEADLAARHMRQREGEREEADDPEAVPKAALPRRTHSELGETAKQLGSLGEDGLLPCAEVLGDRLREPVLTSPPLAPDEVAALVGELDEQLAAVGRVR